MIYLYKSNTIFNGQKNKSLYLILFFQFLLFSYCFSQVPIITSFTPASGPIGTSVDILGVNFSTTPSNNIVYFGGVKATVISASATMITVSVPPGITYQPISVMAGGLIAYSKNIFDVTFTGTIAFSQNSFGVITDSIVGSYPSAFALSDCDQDGKIDMAVTNSNTAAISMQRNLSTNKTISFSSKANYGSGITATNIIYGDLNGDGKLDIITVSNSTNNVSVYRNTSTIGNVAFTPAGSFSTGNSPNGIGVGDIDGDGKLDLAVVNSYPSNTGGNSVSVLRNTSSGATISFATQLLFLTGSSPSNVAIGDLDGDGKSDLAVTNLGGGTISILRNTSTVGNISFAPKTNFTIKNGPNSICMGDLNGDGMLDLVITRSTSDTFAVLKNISTVGNISFAPKIDCFAGLSPISIAIGDLNGDGKPDLAVANSKTQISGGSYNISVLKNISLGTSISFDAKTDYSLGNQYQPTNVSIGDVDIDGKPDIAVSFSYNQSINPGIIKILRNKIGEPVNFDYCEYVADTIITSNLTGMNYQWQIDKGAGFENLEFGLNYSGVKSNILHITGVSSFWYGYKYRCIVDENNSDVYTIRIVNKWIGTTDNAWETPSNWSCGMIPDKNTDVIIDKGIVELNSNTEIRSLNMSLNASITIKNNFNLIINH